MDSLSSDLHSKGIGAQWRSTEIITIEDKNLFWAKGSLGSGSPQMLQHTVFFYKGLQFCLRGVHKQYELSPSQLIRYSYPLDMTVYNEGVYYQYSEFISKTISIGLRTPTSPTNRYVLMLLLRTVGV